VSYVRDNKEDLIGLNITILQCENELERQIFGAGYKYYVHCEFVFHGSVICRVCVCSIWISHYS